MTLLCIIKRPPRGRGLYASAPQTKGSSRAPPPILASG
jgi:hypothetical protein